MATATTDPLVGRLVDGRYEVVSRIARGGMATVYVAVDQRLERQVALKVMHAHLADGPAGAQFVARFRREARAAARLAHPAIVSVYDQGIDDTMSYLAMEYVAGTTLRHALHDEGPFSLGRTLDTLESVCEALAAAHRAGLVHRDVKPENVLIDTDGRIRITDFGLARAVDEATTTTTGTVMGTVAYLSPELIARGAADARTDVYAVGIMAHEMVTGSVPHAGGTPIQVAFAHVNTDVRPPSDLVSGVPVEIDELVCALTARNPDERPTDAAAALALIRATRAALSPADLAHAPAAATRPATNTAVTRVEVGPVPEDPTDPATTALLDFRPAATPLPATAAPHAPQEARPDATRPVPGAQEIDSGPARGPRRRLPWVLAAVVLLVASVVGGLWWWTQAGPGAYTTVPAGVVGAPQATAEGVLDTAHLAHTAEQQYHDTVPQGSVVSTNPGTGDKVRKDGTVHLVVSRGVLLLTMPSGLVGQDSAKATTALTGAGFTVADPTRTYSDSVPADEVMAVTGPQGPIADGDSLPHNTPVALSVSRGPEPIVVNSVVGQATKEAIAALEAQGLVVKATQENSDTVPEGQVIRQDPAAHADAHRTDAATIVVSLGPPMVDVPDLTTKNIKEARDILEAAGFKVDVEYPQGIHPFNMVYGQTPEGGSEKRAQKGSTVTLRAF